MLVSDVMHGGGVQTIDKGAAAAHAAGELRARRISSLAVTDGGHLVGILTERDIVGLVADARDAGTTNVGELMTGEPVTVAPTTDVRDAARIMAEHGIRHLPVVDGEDLVGMLSVRDLFAWTMAQMGDTPELWPDLMAAIAVEWPH